VIPRARGRALLVGNGVNLTAGLRPSWDDIVRDAFRIPREQGLEPRMKLTPFPLLIESAFDPSSIAQSEAEMQRRLAEQFAQWQPGHIHTQVANADVDHILTTNWDLAIERAAGTEVRVEKPFQRETRYSLFRRNILPNGKRLWHIHGSSQAPDTMVLGFEHYAGHLQVVRQVMVGERVYKHRRFGPVHKLILADPPSRPCSWLEVALTHHLLIIGLRLDFAELALWWLLTHRFRQLRKANGSMPETRVIYAYSRQESDSDHDLARCAQLNACGVEIWGYSSTWEEVYQRSLDRFAEIRS
jgi:hypothetical protein